MPERSDSTRYMPDRVSLEGLSTGAALIAGAIAIGALAAFAVVHLGNEGSTPQQAARPGRPPPVAAPIQLQPAPDEDIAAFRADKQRALQSYGWADRERGFARIPIEQAMALRVSRSRAGSGGP